MRPLGWVEKPVDRVLLSISETFRTCTHESWQYASQVANAGSLFVLGIVHKSAFDSYLKQKGRIRYIEPNVPMPGVSPFANILQQTPIIPADEEGMQEVDLDGINNIQQQQHTKQSSPHVPGLESLRYHSHKAVLSGEWEETVSDDCAEESPSGLFEDIKLFQLTIIDFFFSKMRWLWHSFMTISIFSMFSMRNILLPFFIFRTVCLYSLEMVKILFQFFYHSLFHPSDMLSKRGMDFRSKEEIIVDSGYPYEIYPVTTKDGYIIQLERLPNPGSSKVVYFQHGIIDSGFTWIAAGSSSSLALAAYDNGYDVFLGNFRGNPKGHCNPKISSSNYWNFNVNAHAWCDIPAFVTKIQEIKKEEMGIEPDGFKLTLVGHSMGGMAALMYIIKCGLDKIPHGLSKAILLSPAGIHKDSPPLAVYGAPIIHSILQLLPFIHYLKLPTSFVRAVSTKVMEDLKSTNPTKELLTYIITTLIGGSVEDHSLNRVDMLRWIFTGTPVNVLLHFFQLISTKRFQAFDYGRKGNLREYGTKEPLCLLDHYDKLDIPIYFMMGIIDNLIRPANVIAHFEAHFKHHPNFAFLKAFADAGHVEFTLGASEEMTNVLLSCLKDEDESSVTFHSIKQRTTNIQRPEDKEDDFADIEATIEEYNEIITPLIQRHPLHE